MRFSELSPNRENASIDEIKVAMECTPRKRVYIRLNAIRSLLLGYTNEQVVELFVVSLRTVQLWINRYNQGGIDALLWRPISGRPRKIELKQVSPCLLSVIKNPQQEGEHHWTGVKLHGYLKETFKVELSYRTCLNYLHELNINLRYPRKWSQKQDELKRAKFLENIKDIRSDDTVRLWFCDECGVEGDPRPRRRWVVRGSKPKIPYTGLHIRNNIIGAVNPDSGELFSLIFDGCDTSVFQYFIDHLANAIPRNKNQRNILVLDNASWHKAKILNWHHFEVLYLPPYSPDFNPIERLWLNLKAKFFADFIAKTNQQLTDRICEALNYFMKQSNETASICAFTK